MPHLTLPYRLPTAEIPNPILRHHSPESDSEAYLSSRQHQGRYLGMDLLFCAHTDVSSNILLYSPPPLH